MGFPNIDKYLVKRFIENFSEIQFDDGFAINDTFDDMDSGQIAEIAMYLNRKTFTPDLRSRGGNQVFVFPHFPQLDMPLPQIGISLGQETASDHFLGDAAGNSTRYPLTGTQTHWDVPKIYIGAATYRIDVVTATKDEAIWLARMIQRFLCELQEELSNIGVYEMDIVLADLKLEQDQQPQTIFNRAVQINCKIQNSWTKRIPMETYQTGINTAL